jgi:TP901 family phage tail tape measure protein
MAINLPIVSKFDDKGIKGAEKALAGFGKIAAGVAAAATAAVAGIAVKSIQEFAKFDEQLNKSLAIMGDVSEAMRGEMSDAAREVAKSTTFSADQAAESFFFLASAGLDAEAAVAAMPQVAKFAQAGMFDMALATDLATDAQSALGLSSKDATENLENLTRITDVFVRANTLANTSVEQLATAFTTKAGTALKTVGKDVEEGAAALALFADQGVKGEIAGTQLTNTIFGLTDRALKAPAAFEKLGISVFDAEGNMRNFADIADDLGGAFQGMTEEQKLAELGALGFTKQARAGVLMLSGQGDKIRDYEAALRDAAGFTQDVASKQLLTPTAQFALLGSAMNDVAIEIGSFLAPALGGLAGNLASLINHGMEPLTNFLETRVGPAVKIASDFIGEFFARLSEGSISVAGTMEKLVDAIVGFFTGDGLTKLLNGFIEMRATIIDAFIKVIPMVVGAVVMILPAIVETIAKMLPTILDQAVETFNALVEAVVIVLPMLLKALLDMLPDIIKSIISMLPKIVESAITLFTGLVTAVIKVVPELIQAIIDALPQIIDAIIDALPQIIEAGFTLFAGLATALYRAFPDIIKALLELLPGIISTILGLVPQLISAGFELVKGLAKGMIDNIPKLLGEAAKAIGGALTNGVKAVFQIKSPSRVFMDIGENVVTGLEEGITDNLRQLENASIGMASTVTATAENNMSGLSAPMPILGASQGSSGGMTLNLTVNAGMGADGADIGRKIVDEILRFERSSGKVFARA